MAARVVDATSHGTMADAPDTTQDAAGLVEPAAVAVPVPGPAQVADDPDFFFQSDRELDARQKRAAVHQARRLDDGTRPDASLTLGRPSPRPWSPLAGQLHQGQPAPL